MENFIAAFETWMDPQIAGSLILDWLGRILAAAAIFLIGVGYPRPRSAGSRARSRRRSWTRRSPVFFPVSSTWF